MIALQTQVGPSADDHQFFFMLHFHTVSNKVMPRVSRLVVGAVSPAAATHLEQWQQRSCGLRGSVAFIRVMDMVRNSGGMGVRVGGRQHSRGTHQLMAGRPLRMAEEFCHTGHRAHCICPRDGVEHVHVHVGTSFLRSPHVASLGLFNSK
jgi:hypothetical protein